MYDINTLISSRKSELAFNPIAIPGEPVKLLFEAARWAASSFNEQPWRFYFASRDNQQGFAKLLNILAPGNREWAQNASLLIISTAKRNITRNGNENFYALHDTALAEANLLLQAQSMGLATHVMGGFDHDAARTELNIPVDHIPVAAIAVGYPGDIESMSPAIQQRASRPRQRKQVEEFVVEVTD